MLRYAITDRHLFAGDERARRDGLLAQAHRLAAAGVDFLQLREKDLGPVDLLQLAQALGEALHASGPTQLLINIGSLARSVSQPSEGLLQAAIALLGASDADGLHLPGGWLPAHVHGLRSTAPPAHGRPPRISVAAHSIVECRVAAQAGANLILFSPVFEKQLPDDASPLRGVGLSLLAQAVAAAGSTPVLALGGVTPGNAASCIAAGAAGVAGIRLFAAPSNLGPDSGP